MEEMPEKPPAPPAPSTLDARAYEYLNGLPHSRYSDRYIGLVSDLGEGAGWAFAGLWLAVLEGRRGRGSAIGSPAAAALSTYIAQRLLKPVFRRNRPWFTREAARVVGGKTPDHSFPSGHTAASFAAATALAIAYPSARPLLFATATAVGVSRIHLGHHFPSDVIAGGPLGTWLGLLSGLRIGVRDLPGRSRKGSLGGVEGFLRARAG